VSGGAEELPPGPAAAVQFPHPEEQAAILAAVRTPAFVLVERQLHGNLALLGTLREETGARLLLALKGYAPGPLLGAIGSRLDGSTASSPHEARLAREEIGGEVHGYAPAYGREDLLAMAGLCDHLVFNSPGQARRWAGLARTVSPSLTVGLRVHPEHSEGQTPLYDPGGPDSRLGTRAAELAVEGLPEEVSGLHFHTLCEQDADALERTLVAFEDRFARWFPRLSWVNFGGGHHLTREGYDRERLVRVVRSFRERTGLAVYLEPGEAVGLNTGVLVASVLDLAGPGGRYAILDTSATAHLPDVLEMPYRPEILGAGLPGEKAHTYQLGGLTCLAGDVLGDYSFDRPLAVGDRLLFGDMGHYTMVKTTTFNGVRLPDIAVLHEDGTCRTTRTFDYRTFRERLG
jgi:carboxynorspermidine decarboxylase